MATLKQKRTCGQRCEDFGQFVWNSDNGTLMGRTPEKWASFSPALESLGNLRGGIAAAYNSFKAIWAMVEDVALLQDKHIKVYISLYYVAFYVVMTGLFSLSIWTLMYTLDPYAPDYQDRLKSPGVMVWPDTYGEEDVEITYNTSDKASWMKMTNILHTFLEPYNDTKQLECNNYNCTKGKYFVQKSFSAPNHTKWACPFKQSMLGACSGFQDPTFGYNCTMPCVIIKMNRVIDFLPSNPFVNCTVLEGQANVNKIEYFPPGGVMDLSYFPYYGKQAQPTYVNPLVAVRFDLVGKKQAKIQCRVVSDKISYQNIHDPFEGKVTFCLKAVK